MECSECIALEAAKAYVLKKQIETEKTLGATDENAQEKAEQSIYYRQFMNYYESALDTLEPEAYEGDTVADVLFDFAMVAVQRLEEVAPGHDVA